jgi:3-oxoadipyl-CoA thiolase
MSREVFICDAIRTPIGRFGGGLASVRADDLAAIPLKALLERNPQIDWNALDEVFMGCANQAGEDNRNVARMAAAPTSRAPPGCTQMISSSSPQQAMSFSMSPLCNAS